MAGDAIPPKRQPKATGYWRRGEPWVWASGAALAAVLLMAGAMLGVVLLNGVPVFWPRPIQELALVSGEKILGELRRTEDRPDGVGERLQYHVGNRELHTDFRWVDATDIASRATPPEAVRVERLENGVFMGFFSALAGPDGETTADPAALERALTDVHERERRTIAPLQTRLAAGSAAWQRLADEERTYAWKRDQAPAGPARDEWERRRAGAAARAAGVRSDTDELARALTQAREELRREQAVFRTADDARVAVPLADIVRAWWPNRMGLAEKIANYAGRAWALLTEAPREANTEGGLWPAIFGTVFLVFLMAISAFPLGVAAGVYLREYARDGWLVRAVRIAVNNLAGIPSIVYGIFGLGFFVYGLGQALDEVFFPARVAAGVTTFGTGGVLWASLTLGLLTLPVVIVATEEALGAIPGDIRQASLALGATRLQTLWRVLLPMASPGILTGFILAMARAAGEVAPLMLTGAVKSAQALAADGTWPYLHLERKFMHLGFYLYDVAFQSPNVEAALPMVYATTLVLLGLVLALNAAAMIVRNRMRKRYQLRSV